MTARQRDEFLAIASAERNEHGVMIIPRLIEHPGIGNRVGTDAIDLMRKLLDRFCEAHVST